MSKTPKGNSWIHLTSADILNSNIGTLKGDLKAFDYLDLRPTIFLNESSRKDADLNSFDLLNIFGDYDSHAFPSAHEIQVTMAINQNNAIFFVTFYFSFMFLLLYIRVQLTVISHPTTPFRSV